MKGITFPFKIPMLEATRVIKEIHSIGPVILKFVSHCLIIAFTGEILILLTMEFLCRFGVVCWPFDPWEA
jgi:hypothetical protein